MKETANSMRTGSSPNSSPNHRSSAKCDATTTQQPHLRTEWEYCSRCGHIWNSPVRCKFLDISLARKNSPCRSSSTSQATILHMETATETEPHQSSQVTQKRQALRLRNWEIFLLKVISRFSVLPLLASAPSVPTNDNKPTFPCHARRISCWNGLIFKKFANNFPF